MLLASQRFNGRAAMRMMVQTARPRVAYRRRNNPSRRTLVADNVTKRAPPACGHAKTAAHRAAVVDAIFLDRVLSGAQ